MRLTSLLLVLSLCITWTLPAFTGDVTAQTRMERGKADAEPRATIDAEQIPETYAGCYELGTQRADLEIDSGGWFAGGLASGVALGLIGTGILWAVSRGEVDPSPQGYQEMRGECLDGYLAGFRAEAKSKKSKAALGGGLIGTAIIVGVILSTNAD